MEESKRGFEIVDGRVSGDDDGQAIAGGVLERGQEQGARLDGGSRDVQARLGDALADRAERLRARQLLADLREESVVTLGHAGGFYAGSANVSTLSSSPPRRHGVIQLSVLSARGAAV